MLSITTTTSQLPKLEVLGRLDSEILYLVKMKGRDLAGIYTILVRIDDLSKPKTTPPAPPTLPRDGAGAESGGTGRSTVRLPKLSIQPFERDLTTWVMFWDS